MAERQLSIATGRLALRCHCHLCISESEKTNLFFHFSFLFLPLHFNHKIPLACTLANAQNLSLATIESTLILLLRLPWLVSLSIGEGSVSTALVPPFTEDPLSSKTHFKCDGRKALDNVAREIEGNLGSDKLRSNLALGILNATGFFKFHLFWNRQLFLSYLNKHGKEIGCQCTPIIPWFMTSQNVRSFFNQKNQSSLPTGGMHVKI